MSRPALLQCLELAEEKLRILLELMDSWTDRTGANARLRDSLRATIAEIKEEISK